jgi:hypothetical protein
MFGINEKRGQKPDCSPGGGKFSSFADCWIRRIIAISYLISIIYKNIPGFFGSEPPGPGRRREIKCILLIIIYLVIIFASPGRLPVGFSGPFGLTEGGRIWYKHETPTHRWTGVN